MNTNASRRLRPVAGVALSAVLLALQGCPCGYCPRDEDRIEAAGVVIGVGAIQGAVVCADVNANGLCDAGEPRSTPTDAQGRYRISGPVSGQPDGASCCALGVPSAADRSQASGTTERAENFVTSAPAPVYRPLIAMVPADAVDSGKPGATVGTAYTMRLPEGWGGVISPATTLVQAGVTQGLQPVDALAAVAAQLQVATTSVYSDYTVPASGDGATLAALAPALVAGLQTGAPVSITAPLQLPADYHVRDLRYTDANNYTLRYFYATNTPESTGAYTFYDLRTGRTAGVPAQPGGLYDSALLATATGWASPGSATAHTIAAGSPSVLSYAGGAYAYVAARTVIDVAGQPMADVLRQTQDLAVNSSSSTAGVNTAALTGTMPAGAKLLKITTIGVTTPVAYRVADGFVPAPVATLAAMLTAYPTPNAPSPANTLPMGALHGSTGCGATLCPQEFLRVAFGPGNTAAYTLCDLDRATGMQSNCTAAGNGTYALGTAADNATPIMKFAGLPAAAAVQTVTRVFVERDGHVYHGYQEKPVTATQTRLNRVAFEAVAPALGIAPPQFSSSVSAYAGNWSAAFTGNDTGSCPVGSIDVLGQLSGSCSSSVTLQSFTVSGTVSASGAANFTSSGGSSSGATFTGTLNSTTGSGTWMLPIPLLTGSWTASRQP